MPRPLAALCCALLAACALAACGGNDKADAEKTVKDFVKATNDRDADSWCGRLVTQQFIERSTGATGDRAQAACKQQLKALKSPNVKLVQIRNTKVKGDAATVTATIAAQGQSQDLPLHLKKDGGRWKISGGSGG